LNICRQKEFTHTNEYWCEPAKQAGFTLSDGTFIVWGYVFNELAFRVLKLSTQRRVLCVDSWVVLVAFL